MNYTAWYCTGTGQETSASWANNFLYYKKNF